MLQVLQQLLALHRQGHTLIVITHELEKVLAHADRLIIMEKGKVESDGAPEKVITEVERFGIKIPYGENRKVETMNMAEINIFHYIPEDSLIHHLDSRIKLACLILFSVMKLCPWNGRLSELNCSISAGF